MQYGVVLLYWLLELGFCFELSVSVPCMLAFVKTAFKSTVAIVELCLGLSHRQIKQDLKTNHYSFVSTSPILFKLIIQCNILKFVSM